MYYTHTHSSEQNHIFMGPQSSSSVKTSRDFCEMVNSRWYCQISTRKFCFCDFCVSVKTQFYLKIADKTKNYIYIGTPSLFTMLFTLHSISACLRLASFSWARSPLFCAERYCTFPCRLVTSCSALRKWLLLIWFWNLRPKKERKRMLKKDLWYQFNSLRSDKKDL